MLQPLPSDISSERALIGSLLIDSEIIDKYFDNFGIEEIYNDNNKIILEAIFELAVEGILVDLVTVQNKLIEKEQLNKIGGIEYLVEMMGNTPTSANWYSYAKIIQNLYKRREIIKKARLLEKSAFDWEKDINTLVENTYSDINKTLQEGEVKALSYMDIKKKISHHIKESSTTGLLGYSWGLEFLDRYTGGIRKGKTYRIAGGSGIGKTNLFYHMIPKLLEQGAKVMFVSLENTIESTYLKIMSSVIGKNPSDIEKGIVPFDYEWLKQYKDKFFITDQIFNFDDIKREILKVKPDVVLLDYLQQIEIKGVKNELEKLDKYAGDVKKFVLRNQDIAWIDISQLAMNGNNDELKKTGNFKGSGELKNAVDFGLHMFYYEPFFKYKDLAKGTPAEKEIENRTAIEFAVTKNRLGPTFGKSVFGINFDEGIRYKTIPEETLEKWF